MVILENIDIDKAILQNIDIDKISNRFKFGISNRAKLPCKILKSNLKVFFCAFMILIVVFNSVCEIVSVGEADLSQPEK